MFIRELKNRSGSTSIQIISKENGRYKVVKSIGCATMLHEIEKLKLIGKQEIEKISGLQSIHFGFEKDEAVEQAFELLQNSNIQTIGPELIFGKIYDFIGFNKIKDDLFRHLVISRLAFPLSKLKTAEYLYRYHGIHIEINAIYRFLDKLNNKLKTEIEQIIFDHTKSILGGKISVVFYDMTTLYFEASDEDDLRKTGFNKEGKHQCPQIYIGLLVGLGGYAIGYDIFEGNIYEGHTLLPFIERISKKHALLKPIIIADAGLLSKENIKLLEANNYEYILGARIKNESNQLKNKIISKCYDDRTVECFVKNDKTRIIVNYSHLRAKKDAYNRKRGLIRLEKRVKSGKLTKSSINNRGYNKYLKLEGKVNIEIDYSKYEQDSIWDGLKGFITNSKLSDNEVIENYRNLWQIEKAFRISKTDLRIRPIYHRLQNRIEAHICISFAAYSIYKDLERVLYAHKSSLSLKKASEITHNIYQITYTLPETKCMKTKLLKMNNEQKKLYNIILENF